MSNEVYGVIDKDFRAAVAGLEIEISDTVMRNLLAAIANRIQEDRNNSAASLLLLAMDYIVRYVDALRARSHPEAFNLINDLWQGYERILIGNQGEREYRELALGKMKKVLDWQFRCLVDGAGDKPVSTAAERNLSPAVAELVQREIAETGNLIQQELAALKQVAGAVSTTPFQQSDLKQNVSSAIVKEVSSLQVMMNKEIDKLRQDLQLDSGQNG